MSRLNVGLFAAVVLAAVSSAADSKDAPKPTGAWTRDAGNEVTITLEFKADKQLTATAKVGDAAVTAECKYAVEADGLLKVTVTSVSTEGTVSSLPPALPEFEFKFKIDGKTAALADFKIADLEAAKKFLEGDYKAKEK